MRRRSASSLLAEPLRRPLLPMGFLTCAFLFHLLSLAASAPAAAQPLSPARMLDSELQAYAFRALARPRTGVVVNATLPGNLTGVAASAVRLRSGSLRRRGLRGYFEFDVPAGVAVRPFVERVVLVYHDLGARSDRYYPPVPGHTYLAPLLGLLAYDAADLSAVGLPEQGIVATGAPISVTFRRVREAPPGAPAPRCVHFDLDGGGVPRFSDLARGNACSAYRQGHFSIVVNSSAAPPAPPPPPPGATAGGRGKKGGGSTAWKIAGGVVGAAVALGPLAALTICLVRHRRHRKLETMERNAEDGEAFRMARVGRAQAPVASGTRTQPAIESD
jgi:hypothetical protein